MSEIDIQRVSEVDDRSLPIFAEFERLADQIRMEAYRLFAHRGAGEGRALDDWLAAERKHSWPAAELVELDDEYRLKIALAGFDRKEVTVTATPGEILVQARHEQEESRGDDEATVQWSEFRANDLFRRIEMPTAVDVARIEARLRNGLLEITAPKAKPKKLAPKRATGAKRGTKARSKSKSAEDIEFSTPT